MRALLALVLVSLAVALPAYTLRQAKAEMLLKRTRLIIRVNPDIRSPEIHLREALRLDPQNAQVMLDLAEFLLAREKRKVERGEYLTQSPEKFEEASQLLEQSLALLPSPKIVRRRAEVEYMLAELHQSRRDAAAAREALENSYEEFRRASLLLPEPRRESEVFNSALMTTAQDTGRDDVSLEFVHRMNRHGQRWYYEDRGLTSRVEVAWLKAGLFAHQARELRYKLQRNPHDARTLDVAERASRELGLLPVVLLTLEDLEERGLLDENGRGVLERLRAQDERAFDQDNATTPTLQDAAT